MITMKDPSLSTYPNRQQMLALIEARTTLAAGNSAEEPRSATSDTPPYPTCVLLLTD
jgi:hypothetical protein